MQSSTIENYQEICSFCAEIKKETNHNLFRQIMGEQIDNLYLLKETKNFVLMPGIGSFMPGYLLIVPKEHVLSFGFLNKLYDEELLTMLQEADKWIEATFNNKTIWFEHGSASFTNRGGSCTDHAHLHIVPVPNEVDLVSIMYRDFKVRSIDNLSYLRNQIETGVPYLFLKDYDGKMYLCDAPNAKSQHLRRDLAKQLNLGEIWDWLVFPGKESILETIRLYNERP